MDIVDTAIFLRLGSLLCEQECALCDRGLGLDSVSFVYYASQASLLAFLSVKQACAGFILLRLL